MTPYQAYVSFQALKRHFTSDYDYIKYNGKVKADPAIFDLRKDKHQYQKLSKKKDPLNFLVANFVERNLTWIGDAFDSKSEQAYNDWLKRQQSMSYIFTQDLENLCTLFNDNFIVVDGKHPMLLKMFLRRQVCIETLIILDDILGIFKRWDKNIQDTVLWPAIQKKCTKYKPFFHYDAIKCKNILKNKFIGD